MALKTRILTQILKLLSSKLSTVDTPTFQLNPFLNHGMVLPISAVSSLPPLTAMVI
jgi:hypothetical protein